MRPSPDLAPCTHSRLVRLENTSSGSDEILLFAMSSFLWRSTSCPCHYTSRHNIPSHHVLHDRFQSRFNLHPSCTSLFLFLGYVLDPVRLSPPVLTSDYSGWQRHSPEAPRFDCFQGRESCSEKYHASTLASFDISLLCTNLHLRLSYLHPPHPDIYTCISVRCVREFNVHS